MWLFVTKKSVLFTVEKFTSHPFHPFTAIPIPSFFVLLTMLMLISTYIVVRVNILVGLEHSLMTITWTRSDTLALSYVPTVKTTSL